MKIDIETLKRTKGIGDKTLERIINQHILDENIRSFISKHDEENGINLNSEIILMNGDMASELNKVPDKSIDLILTDLPYGTTACSWDEIIPFEIMWNHYKRIIKDNGVIALFGSEPFSSKLRMSNLDWYKYDWVWQKSKSSNFLNAKKNAHEEC